MTEDTDPRLCVVCHRRELADDEPQTCRRCVTVTRSALTDVVRLFGLLETELHGRVGSSSGGGGGSERPLPMAELLSLMGPGNMIADRDAQPDDAPSVVAVLGGWEDDWRTFRGSGGAPHRATVENASEWLLANLGWAASRHPAFDEFAGDMRSLRFRLLRALGLSDDPVRMGADCFECGETLVRDYAPRLACPHGPDRHTASCDQGGLRDWCRCVGCGRTYTPAQYHLALRAAIEGAEAA